MTKYTGECRGRHLWARFHAVAPRHVYGTVAALILAGCAMPTDFDAVQSAVLYGNAAPQSPEVIEQQGQPGVEEWTVAQLTRPS